MRPIETLILGDVKGYGQFYMFRQKAPDYDENPTKTFLFNNKEYSNVRTLYFDMSFNSTVEPKTSIRENYKNVRYEIVTDDVILAKFALAQNLLSEKTRAIVALENITQLLNSDIESDRIEYITDKLYEAMNDI